MIEQQNGISAIKKEFLPEAYPNSVIENTLKKTNVKFWKAKALKFDTKCNGNKQTSASEAIEKSKKAVAYLKSSSVGKMFAFLAIVRICMLFLNMIFCG